MRQSSEIAVAYQSCHLIFGTGILYTVNVTRVISDILDRCYQHNMFIPLQLLLQ